MKSYPSISREYNTEVPVYVFPKYDGVLIRAEYSNKRGFYKFGTKHVLIDKGTNIYGNAISVFMDKYAEDLSAIFEKNKWWNVICFCEYYGSSSFAGNLGEAPYDVKIFDAEVDGTFLKPSEFIDKFDRVDIPPVLYRGVVNGDIIKLIHNSQLEGMTFEGVVCKGPWVKKKELPLMFKVKSNAWIDKLKEFCNGNNELLARLL